jgi:hypothetical protein
MMLKKNVPLEEVLAKFSKEYERYTDSTKDVPVKLLEQLYTTQQQSPEDMQTLEKAAALQHGLARAECEFIQIEDQQEPRQQQEEDEQQDPVVKETQSDLRKEKTKSNEEL